MVATERRSYAQFCPLARTLDVIGERWTLLVVRELLVGPMRFSDLRDHLPGISGALLTQRLRDLEAAGLVQRTDLPPPAARQVYELTARGHELAPVIYELARFGLAYLDALTPEQPLAPHMMPSGMRTMIVAEALPDRAFVVHIALDDGGGDYTVRVAPPRPGPAVLRVSSERGVPDAANAVIRGPLAILMWVRQGVLSYDDAQAHGLRVEGATRDIRVARALFGLV